MPTETNIRIQNHVRARSPEAHLSSKQPAIYHRNVTPTSSSWRKNKKTQTGPGIRVCIFNAGPPQRISSPLGLSLCSGCSFAPPCNRTHRGHFRYNLYENRGFMPARSSCFVYLPRARAEGSLKFPDRNKLKFLSVCPPKRIKASKQPTTSTTTTDCLLLEAGAQRAHLLFYSYESWWGREGKGRKRKYSYQVYSE